MFSLRESADGTFIYRCHQCGLESEIGETKPENAAEEAVAYSRLHQCPPKAAIHAAHGQHLPRANSHLPD
jgi:hypothetical protein